MSARQTGPRPVVLTLLGVLWPGSDSSGPNQSFRALAHALRDEFEFRVVARDRSFGASSAVAPAGVWFDRDDYHVRYCEAPRRYAKALVRTLQETPHDILMLNGFFDHEFTIPALLARKLGRIPSRPTILSPRGEFSRGALALGRTKKKTWLRIVQLSGLTRGVTYHAASESERADVLARAPVARDCVFVPNIRMLVDPMTPAARPTGPLRVVFIGRISRVKGLDLALQALARVQSPVHFDIYGPAEDAEHWQHCLALMAALPAHVTARWQGEIANEAVPAALAGCDLFLLPSRSENFGHAIFEALSCGVPVLIGPATPWNDLERDDAGFNRPLDANALAAAIEMCAALDDVARARLSQGARGRAERFVAESGAVERARAMFHTLLTTEREGGARQTCRVES